MIEHLALAVVVLAAFYLIGLAVMAIFTPNIAARFLDGFASSFYTHITEMGIRLLVGWAFVVNAPRMLFSDMFFAFGNILVVTSVILLLLPWRWHQRFAQKVVSPIIRHVWLFGIVSLPLGGGILFAVINGAGD